MFEGNVSDAIRFQGTATSFFFFLLSLDDSSFTSDMQAFFLNHGWSLLQKIARKEIPLTSLPLALSVINHIKLDYFKIKKSPTRQIKWHLMVRKCTAENVDIHSYFSDVFSHDVTPAVISG